MEFKCMYSFYITDNTLYIKKAKSDLAELNLWDLRMSRWRYWWNTVVLVRMYRSILSSFRGSDEGALYCPIILRNHDSIDRYIIGHLLPKLKTQYIKEELVLNRIYYSELSI